MQNLGYCSVCGEVRNLEGICIHDHECIVQPNGVTDLIEKNKFVKYPRTLHLPWSKGFTSDDKVLKSVDCFVGKEVVVTEKMDGENTTLYSDHVHARSIDSKNHPSRNLIKALHASIADMIPWGWRICGENLFAKHSIHYHNLPSTFLVFGVYTQFNDCLPWDQTVRMCEMFGLSTVPVLYSGIWDEKAIKKCWTGKCSYSSDDEQEGYVVRNAGEFKSTQHQVNVGKFVRKNHIQTDEHWLSQAIVKNKVKT